MEKVYLGRPWRPFAYTLFIECELGKHILPAGWHNWKNSDNEQTVRYREYKNAGEGADISGRVEWSRQLSSEEAQKITVENLFYNRCNTWKF